MVIVALGMPFPDVIIIITTMMRTNKQSTHTKSNIFPKERLKDDDIISY